MFLKKKPDPRPLGVPLDDLEKAINQTSLKASRDGNSLIVQNENLITRIDVVPPAKRHCGDATIKAVVQIKTKLPNEIVAAFLAHPQIVGTLNKMATLGALTLEKDGINSHLRDDPEQGQGRPEPRKPSSKLTGRLAVTVI